MVVSGYRVWTCFREMKIWRYEYWVEAMKVEIEPASVVMAVWMDCPAVKVTLFEATWIVS